MRFAKTFSIIALVLFVLLFAFLSPLISDSVRLIQTTNSMLQANDMNRGQNRITEGNRLEKKYSGDNYNQTVARTSSTKMTTSTTHEIGTRMRSSVLLTERLPEGTLQYNDGNVKEHYATSNFKVVSDNCEKLFLNPTRPVLSKSEKSGAFNCISNYLIDLSKGNGIWGDNKAAIRWLNHSYLNTDSLVVDIGGNTGIDASNIISRFHPKQYVILEPVKDYYDHLVEKFMNDSSVEILNYGAGEKTTKLNVSLSGTNGDATSIFKKALNNAKRAEIQIRNVAKVFQIFKFSCLRQLDLLTINCEGCEFEVIETLLKTNLIALVKHLQFATHSTLQYLKDPVSRYCRMQELLSRTHKLSYQYKFVWESWQRRDLH